MMAFFIIPKEVKLHNLSGMYHWAYVFIIKNLLTDNTFYVILFTFST